MILSFTWTTGQFLAGTKTCTRRDMKPSRLKSWQKAWDEGRLVHDAVDKVLFHGGKRIGKFRLTCRPYLEKLEDMPPEDLVNEGGMCNTVEDFCRFVGKPPDKVMAVIRFQKL